jgi:ABC-type dipeptide/oligopeptide/nickel transport system ATPase component
MIKSDDLKNKLVWYKVILLPIFPIIWLFYWLKNFFTTPLLRPGIHAIVGDTGSGKTLLASLLARHHAKSGKHVYFNSRINDKVIFFKLENYFDDFRIKKQFLPYSVVFFDEIQRDFNRRQNRSNEYNSIFIPLVEWLTTHRHNKITHVYFITQSFDRFDTQLQELMHRISIVTNRQSPDMHLWLRDKKFPPQIRVKKLIYNSFKRKTFMLNDYEKYVKRGTLQYVKPINYKLPISREDLTSYNTFAFSHRYLKEETKKDSLNEKKDG